MHFHDVQIPGFAWVLIIALLSASTYKIQYGEVVFFVLLAVFAGLKIYQMWLGVKEEKAVKIRRLNLADGSQGKKRSCVARFLVG